MRIHRVFLGQADYPSKLRHIPSPPKQLYYLGKPLGDLDQRPAVAIVGSRRVSTYGRQVTQDLAKGLVKHGVTIISGLAIGVDAIAHQATLEAGGRAVAVLAHGLDHISPAANYQLSQRILKEGGTIVSEYSVGSKVHKSNFVVRNRIVSGVANGILVTEAAHDSGSLHTANFAIEQGRDVFVVPGNIDRPLSVGTNRLLKKGAVPVTELKDILYVLNIAAEPGKEREIMAANQEEATLLRLLSAGVSDGSELLKQSALDARLFNQTLTMMEITNKIKSGGNDSWMLY